MTNPVTDDDWTQIDKLMNKLWLTGEQKELYLALVRLCKGYHEGRYA